MNLANPLDLVLLVALITAGVLGYIACAGLMYRLMRPEFTGYDAEGECQLVAAIWPITMLWPIGRWAWRLGASPRLPTATARERKDSDP